LIFDAGPFNRFCAIGTGNTQNAGSKANDLKLFAPIDSGDRLLETTRLTPPSLLKIDVEGGEIAALSGLKNWLREGRTTLIFEGGADTADYVRSLGYKDVNPCVRNERTDHNLSNYVARAWWGPSAHETGG